MRRLTVLLSLLGTLVGPACAPPELDGGEGDSGRDRGGNQQDGQGTVDGATGGDGDEGPAGSPDGDGDGMGGGDGSGPGPVDPNGGVNGGPREPLNCPPDFAVNGKTAIYARITSATATLTIDVAARAARVKSRLTVDIEQTQGGSPVLDVVPATARFVSVDGGARVALATIASPDGVSVMRMVDAALSPGKHTLDIEEYALRTGRSAYNDTFIEGIDFTSGFEFLTDHDDLEPRFFTERYFPAGFECHRYPFTLTVVVQNPTATQRPDVIANAKKEVSADGRTFTLSYPPNGSTSTWYLHVIDRNAWAFATGEYKSIDGRSIPLSAHAPTQAEANQVIADMLAMFPQLEADYGPYPKPYAIASVGSSNDPMEYDGAFQTDMDLSESTPEDRGALGHEMLHMWFGRSARPLSGRDGWVDEGIAEWRDSGYVRANSLAQGGQYAQLAPQTPYLRTTPDASYEQGALLLSELDFLLRNRGGMKPVLKAFHAQFRDKLYTTEDYLSFIRQSAPDLTQQMNALFLQKVYAGAVVPRT